MVAAEQDEHSGLARADDEETEQRGRNGGQRGEARQREASRTGRAGGDEQGNGCDEQAERYHRAQESGQWLDLALRWNGLAATGQGG